MVTRNNNGSTAHNYLSQYDTHRRFAGTYSNYGGDYNSGDESEFGLHDSEQGSANYYRQFGGGNMSTQFHTSTFNGASNLRDFQRNQLYAKDQPTALKGYFFESPSKYVSLKQYNEDNSYLQFQSLNSSQKTLTQFDSSCKYPKRPIFDNSSMPKGLKISEWFERLSIFDKSIVLTIVDKPLVTLIKHMFEKYNVSPGVEFSNSSAKYDYKQSHQIRKINKYNLLCFMKKLNRHPPENETLRKKFQAEQSIVNSVRIAKVIEEDDSLMIDYELFENTQFFFDIIKIINIQKFLLTELQQSKETSRLENSVFYQTKDDSPPVYPKTFFTFVSSSKEIPHHLNLAQVIVYLLEKAINVQYQHYLGRLQQSQINFFFVAPNSNIFYNDHRLTKHWLNPSKRQRERLIKKLDEIESLLIKQDHSVISQIKEESENSDSSELHIPMRRKSDQGIDIESQRPYSQHKSLKKARHFQFPYDENIDEQEDNDDIENHDNELVKSNIYKLSKSKILTKLNGLNSNVENSFKFIKIFSSDFSLEQFQRKCKSHKYKQLIYEFIQEELNQSVYDELLGAESSKEEGQPTQTPGQTSNSQKKKNKKAKKNKAKAQEATKKQEVIQAQEEAKSEMRTINIVKDLLKQDNNDDLYKIPIITEQATMLRRRLEERKSLLTGEIQYDKYLLEDGFNPGRYEGIALDLEEATEKVEADPEKETSKKKKRKKNKKNNKKKQNEANEVSDQPLVEQKREDDEIESIHLEQIDLGLDSKNEDLIDSERKINNYFDGNQQTLILTSINDETDLIDEQAPCLDTIRKSNSVDEENIEEAATHEYVQNITSGIFQQIIEGSTLAKQAKHNPIERDQSNEDNNKKKSKRRKYKNQKTIREPSAEKVEVVQKAEESQIINEEQKDESFSFITPRLNSEEFNIRLPKSQPKPKREAFRITQNEPEYNEVRIPMRGSSRGSSGAEESIHKDTINNFDGLFPQVYKNPIDDTKSKISEITSQSSQEQTFEVINMKPTAKNNKGKLNKERETDDGHHHQAKKKGANYKTKTKPIIEEPQNIVVQKPPIETKNQQLDQSLQLLEQAPFVEQDVVQPSQTTGKQQQLEKRGASPKAKKKKSTKVQKLVETKFDNYEMMFQKAFMKQESDPTDIQQLAQSIEQDRTNDSEAISVKDQSAEITSQHTANEQIKVEQSTVAIDSSSQQKSQKREGLEERGVCVNPQQLEQAIKKQSQNEIKKPKPKVQCSNLSTASIKGVEQRSHTPNVELSSQLHEPLSTNSNRQKKQHNNHNKNSNALQLGNHQKHHNKYGNNKKKQPPNASKQNLLGGKKNGDFKIDQQQQLQQHLQQNQMHQFSTQNQYMMPLNYMPNLIPQPMSQPLYYPQSYHPQQQTMQYMKPQSSQQTQTDESRMQDASDISNQMQRMDQKQQTILNQFQNINISLNFSPPPTHYPYNPFVPQQLQQPCYGVPYQHPYYQQPPPNISQTHMITSLFQNFLEMQANSMPGKQPQFTPPQLPKFNHPPHTMSVPHSKSPLPPQSSKLQQQKPFVPSQSKKSNLHETKMQTPKFGDEKSTESTKVKVSHQSKDQYDKVATQTSREEEFFQRFDQEIYKLQNKIKFKVSKTENERQTAFKLLESLVQQTFSAHKEAKIQMYGSMASGLAIDSSDMDVLVSGVFNSGPVDRTILVEQMYKLYTALKDVYCLESNHIIESATVPVIKIVKYPFLSLLDPQLDEDSFSREDLRRKQRGDY